MNERFSDISSWTLCSAQYDVRAFRLAYFLTLKMEEVRVYCPEMSANFYQTTRRNTSYNNILHN
jgi:hypothetical protein